MRAGGDQRSRSLRASRRVHLVVLLAVPRQGRAHRRALRAVPGPGVSNGVGLLLRDSAETGISCVVGGRDAVLPAVGVERSHHGSVAANGTSTAKAATTCPTHSSRVSAVRSRCMAVPGSTASVGRAFCTGSARSRHDSDRATAHSIEVGSSPLLQKWPHRVTLTDTTTPTPSTFTPREAKTSSRSFCPPSVAPRCSTVAPSRGPGFSERVGASNPSRPCGPGATSGPPTAGGTG